MPPTPIRIGYMAPETGRVTDENGARPFGQRPFERVDFPAIPGLLVDRLSMLTGK
jgi:hypothetical protein